jgi:hypothetical protein
VTDQWSHLRNWSGGQNHRPEKINSESNGQSNSGIYYDSVTKNAKPTMEKMHQTKKRPDMIELMWAEPQKVKFDNVNDAYTRYECSFEVLYTLRM